VATDDRLFALALLAVLAATVAAVIRLLGLDESSGASRYRGHG